MKNRCNKSGHHPCVDWGWGCKMNLMRSKKTFTPKPEKFDLEASIHLLVHFFGVALLFWVTIFLPIWFAILFLIFEYLQMKAFGHCFLTVYAHKRGYMQGLTYWEYVPKLLGFKNYKELNKIISSLIEKALVGILVLRLLATIF